MMALVLAVALSQAPNSTLENPLLTKAREKTELIEKLRRDIFKVDRSIGETDKLIARSRNAPYLPDLQFRLAELYVEKSRYVYYLQAETRPEGIKGAMVSPETKLLKQKAIQIYTRVLREFPDFKDADKLTFYLAHEQRELGEFDAMLKTQGDLIRKYPSSPLRLDAEQILGDYWFDKADLKQAEEHYRAILDAPPSPVHDLARYKMGWIRINQANHAEAVTFFEAAAASAPLPGVDVAKALSVKREALLDLVYSYTEARPAKGAIQYFEKLSDSRATFSLALDKLGNRYFIKQQYEYAIPALRKLLEIQPDPELEVERVEKLYDSLKASKGKVQPKPEDVMYLVRAAVQIKTDPARDEVARKKVLVELEEMGRDLSTLLHVQAQKKEDKALYLEAAAAYEKYLALFRPKQYATVMMQNRADALFAAKRFPEAARQFEELARYLDSTRVSKESKEGEKADPNKLDVTKAPAAKDSKAAAVASVTNSAGTKTIGGEMKTHDEALYGALLAHYSSLKPGEVERLNAFEVADARQALKLLGAQYLGRYPKSEHALEVKFNIARAYYEDGDYKKSAELFKEFALNHSDNKDAPVAGNLAFDSLRQLNDFKAIDAYGKAFLASNLPPAFKGDVQKILTQSKSEALGELALKSSEATGDVITGLLQVADENKGQEIGEKALYGAFAAAREKRDLRREREIGDRLIKEYAKSQYISDVMLTLGRHAAEAGRFQDAAAYFEQMGRQFAGDSTGLDSMLASARLRTAMGDFPGAVKVLETTIEQAGARKAEVLVLLAQTYMKMKSPAKGRATAEQALKVDKTNATAASIVAEVAASNPNEKLEPMIAMMTTITNSPNGVGDDAAKGLWYVGDMLYRQFKAIPGDKIEEKVAALQQMQGVFQQAASMGSAEWAVASLWRIGNGLQNIADSVEATPAPAGLKPAEIEQFRAAVKAQVDPLKANAENTFQTCISRAESLEVFTAAAVGCRKKVDEASSPLKGPPAERAVNVEELQKKAELTQNAAEFEALGLAYLGAGQVNNAILNLNRAIEIEDTRASAHSALGYSFLLTGDSASARGEYGRALEADPTFDKARANLAGLKCRYLDVVGAKQEAAVVKDAALAGPDVDPEWKSCK
ncbi:MAG: tetratricopeptide repeat protein [Archangium sp.]|nr:tetratricopeptide repeat protein [Archangium sp.]MDP3572636.1 tetratricopeptide repeat protein [Archangium sp.]